MLLIVRLISAFCMHISDCDETFNYWEPVSEDSLMDCIVDFRCIVEGLG